MQRAHLPLREFAYFDREKVEDFLSALAGGLPSERREASKDVSPAVDAGVDLKLAHVERRGGETELSWEELRSATPASIFEELHRLLAEEHAIRDLGAFQDADWIALQDGDFIEVRCRVEPSALENLFDLIGSFGKLLPVFDPEKAQDPQWQQMLAYLEISGQGERDSYNVRLIPLGAPSPRYTFVVSLDRSKLRVNTDELAGQYTAFGRVQRKLRKAETFELFTLMPRGIHLSRNDLREFLSKLKTIPPQFGRPPTIQDLRVSYPAIVLTPIAVFR